MGLGLSKIIPQKTTQSSNIESNQYQKVLLSRAAEIAKITDSFVRDKDVYEPRTGPSIRSCWLMSVW